MVILKQKISSVSEEEDMNNTTLSTDQAEDIKKRCSDCHTTTTPLWRGGPAGPRSLCNACGIRLRKKRRAAFLGIVDSAAAQEKSMKKKKKKKKRSNSSNSNKLGGALPLKMRLMALGRKMELGEEEQAAILLMALSCGSSLHS